MTKRRCMVWITRGIRILASTALGLAVSSAPSWSQSQCSQGVDSDGDGIFDYDECNGLALYNGTVFPGSIGSDGKLSAVVRVNRLDPNSKDLFVYVVPAATGSFLAGNTRTAIADPFATNNAYGLAFNGFSGLGVAVHAIIGIAPPDRTFSSFTRQKAVAVFEDLDASDFNILGYCVYGTPNIPAENRCTVFTKRAWEAIGLTCGTLPIYTMSGKLSTREEVFKAYMVEMILHEAAHSSGGLTSKYDDRYGGYHYAPGTIMEQYVVASTAKNKCRFAISPLFNSTLDPVAVKLQ